MDRFFDRDDEWLMPVFPRGDFMKPAMNVEETDKEVIAEVEIPGFDPEKIDVTVEDGVLKISGKMEEKKEEKERGYWRKEIRRGSFERAVRLPVAVKEDEAKAAYEKGMLTVTVPKMEAKPSAKVRVESKER